MQIEYTVSYTDENNVEYKMRKIFDLETRTLPSPFADLSDILQRADHVEVKILRDGISYQLRNISVSSRSTSGPPKLAIRALTSNTDRELFEILRTVRKRLAKERGFLAFQVLPDTSLTSMAAYRSQSREHFARLPGVGPKKVQEYFQPFSGAIQAYAAEHNLPVDLEPEDIEKST
jgi:superfamily II DNA helicase RecQ